MKKIIGFEKANIGLKFLILMFCFLFANNIHGQIITKIGSKYMHEGSLYDNNTIGEILYSSEEAFYLYQRSLKSQKSADILGYTSLTAIGLSGLFIYAGASSNDISVGILRLIAGGFMLSIASIVGTIGILAKSSQNKRLKSAVNHYNWEVNQGLHEKTSSIDLQITNNGLGLVFTF